jgi:hypothetical protein
MESYKWAISLVEQIRTIPTAAIESAGLPKDLAAIVSEYARPDLHNYLTTSHSRYIQIDQDKSVKLSIASELMNGQLTFIFTIRDGPKKRTVIRFFKIQKIFGWIINGYKPEYFDPLCDIDIVFLPTSRNIMTSYIADAV